MIIDIFGLKLAIYVPYRSLWMLGILIFLVITSYIVMVRVRRRRVIKLGNFQTLRRVQGFKVTIPHPLLLLAKIITVTLLFLVATDSIQINMVKPVANTDFVIAIDSSQTMLMPDYEPNRLEKAKEESIKWLGKLPAVTSIGVVKFSGKATPVVYPTSDFSRVERGINSINVDLNSSGTAIGDALLLSASMLSESKRQKMVILVTDGKNNAGVNLTEALEKIKKQGVVVYAIGVGNNEETIKFFKEFQGLIKKAGYNASQANLEIPEVDMEALQRLAEETGGKAFEVTNEKGFEEAFKTIITKNERIPLNSDYYVLIFIAGLEIIEMVIFAKFGAL